MTPKENNTPNLYRRGKSGMLYMRFFYLGEFVHRSTQTTDLKRAQKIVQKVKNEIFDRHHGLVPVEPAVVTFSQAIEETYKERWAATRTGLASYHQAYRVNEILKNPPVDSIDTKVVRRAHAELRSLLNSESTVNRYMAAFRTVMKHASESHGCVYPKFNLAKETTGRVRVYLPEEEEAILEWFKESDQEEMADLAAVLIDTGFRLSECLGIGKRNRKGEMISEFNKVRKSVSSWRNKAAKPRTIPLTPRAYEILKRRGSVPFSLNKDQACRNWKKMRDALGLDKESTAHACRHTCASRLLNTGSSLKLVQEWLGHVEIKSTMIYCHLAPNGLEEAMGRLVQTG